MRLLRSIRVIGNVNSMSNDPVRQIPEHINKEYPPKQHHRRAQTRQEQAVPGHPRRRSTLCRPGVLNHSNRPDRGRKSVVFTVRCAPYGDTQPKQSGSFREQQTPSPPPR